MSLWGAVMHSSLSDTDDRAPDVAAGLHPDAVFSADWLALRAGPDARARNTGLGTRARQWLLDRARSRARGAALHLLDLGCGSGANTAFLAGRLPGPQSWHLLDHDAALLAAAAARSAQLCDESGAALAVHTRCCDLRTLQPAQLAGADLITASALIDLVDAGWLEQLALACAQAGCAVLITLSVDGGWRFVGDEAAAPAQDEVDADDAFVRAAFNDHQRRDKGVGGALGPDAAAAFAAALRTRGFDVDLAPSPWRLRLADPAELALALALVQGWCAAAQTQCPAETTRITAWHRRRVDRLRRACGVLEVGHVDLFAQPGAGERPQALSYIRKR